MKKFEYQIVNAEQYEDFVLDLNSKGKEGWELVNYTIGEITDSEGEKLNLLGLMKREI